MKNTRQVASTLKTLMLEPNDWMPNNPRLPVIIYLSAMSITRDDPAALFEKTFSAHGWPPQWLDGVYDYNHYHTEGHEVLGVVSGQARLMLGGPGGQVVEVNKGDVLLLPAGTGHCNLRSSADLLVVGAYPPGQHADIRREALARRSLRTSLPWRFLHMTQP